MIQLTIAHPTSVTTSRKINFMILTEVCFIQMWISISNTHCFMVSSLMDSRFTFTSPCPAPALASNIYNLFVSNPFPQVPFSFNHVPLSLTSQLTTHARYISLPYMIFECRHNIRDQPVSTTIPSPSLSRDITTIRKHHFGEILKHDFLNVFQESLTYS